jgi:hypothetical protein
MQTATFWLAMLGLVAMLLALLVLIPLFSPTDERQWHRVNTWPWSGIRVNGRYCWCNHVMGRKLLNGTYEYRDPTKAEAEEISNHNSDIAM